MTENDPISDRNSRTISTPINRNRVNDDFKVDHEALALLRQIQFTITRSLYNQESDVLLKDYMYDWLNTSRMALRPKTADDYFRTIQKHIIPYLGDILITDLTNIMVEKFYNNLLKAGVGIRTVRLVHSILHRALKKALLQQVITQNPTSQATLPRYIHGEMKVLDLAQVKQFLEAAIESPYSTLYHLALTTGMRMGELLGLQWADIQWGTCQLFVQRQLQNLRGHGFIYQEPKTRAGRRTIQLGDGTICMLLKHREKQQQLKDSAGHHWHDYDLIFPSTVGSPLDPSNLRSDFKKNIKKAGIPRIRFHDLRHTAASLMLNNGIPVIVVSKILGHSSPSITLDIYGHLYHEMQDEAARLMDRLVSSANKY